MKTHHHRAWATLSALETLIATSALLCSGTAGADSGTTPPAVPAPTPIVATGGGSGGSNPGSDCVLRLGLRNTPPPQSAMNAWQTNGDAGWPFGWPGIPPLTVPSTAASVGCSR